MDIKILKDGVSFNVGSPQRVAGMITKNFLESSFLFDEADGIYSRVTQNLIERASIESD